MNITDLKELTSAQYDACKARAVERVQARIGERPTRKQFKRDYAPLWGVLDLLAGLIFLAALAVSSLHILAYSGQEATRSYTTATTGQITGLSVDSHTYGVIHQIGFILLAEAAMLLFFVLFRTRQGFERWVSLVLACLAMIFVIVANLASGLNVFLAVLAPLFTIGIGFRLESLTAESLRRNAEVDRHYLDALHTWERVKDDLSTHPDYLPTLRAELWSKLVSLKANQPYAEAPAAFKLAAVQREMSRELWAYDLTGLTTDTPNYMHSFQPAAASNGHREVAPDAPFVTVNGNGHRT